MSFKPGDFFLGVVSFLGVLLPGTLFLLLHLSGFVVATKLGPPVWIVFAIAAYMVGHLLLAASEMLNSTADGVSSLFFRGLDERLRSRELDYRNAHRAYLSVEASKDEKVLEARAFVFHTALSYVRLRNAAAAAEIDHHMADYKLLRSLVLVLLLNSAILLAISRGHSERSYLEIAISALAYLCFVRMYNWARYLAFDYSVLLIRLPELQLASPPTARLTQEAAAEKKS